MCVNEKKIVEYFTKATGLSRVELFQTEKWRPRDFITGNEAPRAE